MGYIFSIIAFLILTPILLKLPIGIKASSKIFLVASAFFVSILGVFAVNYLELWKIALILLLLSLTLVFLFDKKVVEVEASGYEGTKPSTVKNKVIIFQNQMETDNSFDRTIASNKNEENSDNLEGTEFLENRNALLEVESATNEAASTTEEVQEEVAIDWINEVAEDEESTDVSDTVKDEFEELPVSEQQDWLNDISELTELDPKEDEQPIKTKELDELDTIEELNVFGELEEIEEIEEKKPALTKPPDEENVINVDDLDVLEELNFDVKDSKK